MSEDDLKNDLWLHLKNLQILAVYSNHSDSKPSSRVFVVSFTAFNAPISIGFYKWTKWTSSLSEDELKNDLWLHLKNLQILAVESNHHQCANVNCILQMNKMDKFFSSHWTNGQIGHLCFCSIL